MLQFNYNNTYLEKLYCRCIELYKKYSNINILNNKININLLNN